jgi:probable selenium-dependent hydroxylase accessory protein YqeC
MSARASLPFLEAFGLERNRYVYLVGGGGKTSLLFAASRALVAAGRSVLTTTSTKMLYPAPGESDHVVIAAQNSGLVARLKSEFDLRRHLTAAPSLADEGRKLCGYAVDEIDRLAEARVADSVLVEADGAAGRSLKAHRDHEPVVSLCADLVIVVIGVDCLGKPMNDLYVHRAELFRRRLGRPHDSAITVDDAVAIIFHRDGYLKRVGPGAEVGLFVNKVGTPEAEVEARRLEQAVKESDRERRFRWVVIGDVATAWFQ